MNPDMLLSMLIQTRLKLSEGSDTPFLLQRIARAPLSVSHPMIPEGGFGVDAETLTSFETLVKWGYLKQPKQYDGEGYVITLAGLSYAEHRDGTVWDGTERRQQLRRAGKDLPSFLERRTRG